LCEFGDERKKTSVTIGVVRTGDATELFLFLRATLLDGLVALEGVLTGESLPT